MTDLPEILAIIPARGGSKGIPRKNLRPVLGRPLLAHTIDHALSARSVTRVVVSTDDGEIAAVARASGAGVVMRPPALATDTATSESALLHVLDHLYAAEGYAPDLIVFLQATAPIRRPFDVDRAVAALQAADADSLLSVVPSHSFLWRRADDGTAESVNYDYRHRPRRQDLAPQFAENGSIYVFKPWVLREHDNRLGGKIALYEMDAWSGIDIDTPHDLALCEWIMSHRQSGENPG
jgi:CMP-N,N'-diacetyllegionaminic acid synthase